MHTPCAFTQLGLMRTFRCVQRTHANGSPAPITGSKLTRCRVYFPSISSLAIVRKRVINQLWYRWQTLARKGGLSAASLDSPWLPEHGTALA
jgi:hypothetical protein